MTGSPNYYDVLGTGPGATSEEIEILYKWERAKLSLPELRAELKRLQETGDAFLMGESKKKVDEAREKAKILRQAYNVLTDPTARKEYDLNMGFTKPVRVRKRQSTRTQPTATITSKRSRSSINPAVWFVIFIAVIAFFAFLSSQGSVRPTPASSNPTGSGIYVPSDTSTPQFYCNGIETNLIKGMAVYVGGTVNNNVRSQPTKNSDIVGVAFPGTNMRLLDGPYCDRGQYIYWRVQLTSGISHGLVGYTVEVDSNGRRYLTP